VNAFVLTYNKETWDWDTAEHPRAQFVRDTWSKSVVSGRWSTGNRTGGLQPGDSGYLFRQGTGPRGLIGAGQFTSEIYTAPHFGNPRRFAHYADIDWSDVLSDDQVLPLDDVRQATTGASWAHMQGSGVLLSERDAAALERLWQRHLVDLGRAGRSASAGWEQDTARRQAIEDHAQDLLMRYYEDQGYRVHDTRRGHPYDASRSSRSRRSISRPRAPPVMVARCWLQRARLTSPVHTQDRQLSASSPVFDSTTTGCWTGTAACSCAMLGTRTTASSFPPPIPGSQVLAVATGDAEAWRSTTGLARLLKMQPLGTMQQGFEDVAAVVPGGLPFSAYRYPPW